jgi:pSer/pThr/pTyr-binding forkhead associated (FHA) protein
MIVCPNCQHSNPLGAVQCEACYTPLPAMTHCPNCGTSNAADAAFCGQCGFNLQANAVAQPVAALAAVATAQPMPQPTSSMNTIGNTQLQVSTAKLFHVQTEKVIELPQSSAIVHLGKPNDRIPPDIDLSGYPNSEIVSRIHADIRIEGDAYFVEDVGSSNGTYVNNLPLAVGSRHRLRPGDRIALGKGDKVSFLFQI